jgi:hypothetical protein
MFYNNVFLLRADPGEREACFGDVPNAERAVIDQRGEGGEAEGLHPRQSAHHELQNYQRYRKQSGRRSE